jgi:hypothetical protein
MACQKLELLVSPFACQSLATATIPVPERELEEARQLVEHWLETTFLRRTDAVDDLVRRIGAALAEREGEADR